MRRIFIVFCISFVFASYHSFVKAEQSPTSFQLENADKLVEKLKELNFQGKYQELISKSNEFRDSIRMLIGDSTIYTAWILDELGIACVRTGKIQEAFQNIGESLTIKANLLGATHKEIAVSNHLLGIVYLYSGRMEEALKLFELSLQIRFELGERNSIEMSNTMNNIGVIHHEKGEYENALKIHKEALSIKISNFGEDHITVIDSYTNIGRAYFHRSEYIAAVEYYKKALNIILKILGEEHPKLADIYHNLAVLYNKTGYYEEAADYFEQAITITKKSRGEDNLVMGSHYNGIASNYSDMGYYEKSSYYYLKSLDIRLKILGEMHPHLAAVYNNLGINYAIIGDFDNAEKYHKKAFDIRLNTLEDNDSKIADSYHKIGLINFERNNFQESIQYFENALTVLNKNKNEFPFLETDILLSMCRSYFQMGNTDEAINYLKLSREVLNGNFNPRHPHHADINLMAADIFIHQAEYSKADSCFQLAIKVYHTLNLNFDSRLINTYFQMSKMYKDLQDYHQAYHYVKLATSNMKKLTFSNFYDNTKQVLISKNESIIEESLSQAYRLFQNTGDEQYLHDFIEFMELHKSILLHGNLIHSEAVKFSSIPDHLKELEYNMRVKINHLEKQKLELLNENNSLPELEIIEIENSLFEALVQYEELIAKFEKEYPEYYYLKYNKRIVSLKTIQSEFLQPHQTILFYYAGIHNYYCLAINQDSSFIHQFSTHYLKDSLVKGLEFGITGYYTAYWSDQSTEHYNSTLRSFVEASTELYHLLIKPVAPYLRQELLIISDGLTSLLPFELLLIKTPSQINRFSNYDFLLLDHDIYYGFSLSLQYFMSSRSGTKKPQKSVLAFAPFSSTSNYNIDSFAKNELFEENNDSEYVAHRRSKINLNKLPSSGEEAIFIANHLSGDYLLDDSATVDNFVTSAPDYKILHLSTHGLSDSRLGDFSFLSFSPDSSDWSSSLLFVRNIYDLKLSTQLVVLSACETAKGELQKTEGIIGLSRAFIIAGANSVISSMWLVDDVSTKNVMKMFYTHLKSGSNISYALANAKRDFIKNSSNKYKHPFFWAGFMHYGVNTRIFND